MDTNLRVIRLKNGDDIIAEVTTTEHSKGTSYELRNPMRIMYVMGKNGTSITIAMIDWIFRRIYDHETVVIKEENILAEVLPSKTLQDYYWNYLAENDPTETFEEPEFLTEESKEIPALNDTIAALNDIRRKGGKLN